MISFLKSLDQKVREDFTFLDLSFLKLYAFIPGLIVGSIYPESIKDIYWILVIAFFFLYARYFYLLFIKKSVFQNSNIKHIEYSENSNSN